MGLPPPLGTGLAALQGNAVFMRSVAGGGIAPLAILSGLALAGPRPFPTAVTGALCAYHCWAGFVCSKPEFAELLGDKVPFIVHLTLAIMFALGTMGIGNSSSSSEDAKKKR